MPPNSDSPPAADNASKPVTLKPRRRWLRRIGLSLLVLGLLLVSGHWYWGHRAERQLEERVAELRAAGEPVAPADLAEPAVPDADNAALDLRAAAAAIDIKGDAWEELGRWQPALPLDKDEAALLKRVVDGNQDALTKARAAVGKAGVDWQLQFPPSAMLSVDLKDLNQQRGLAQLLGAAVLSAHHAGDDAEAVRRLREMLFVARALDHQPLLVSHLVAIGIAAMAVERVEMIAPDLRIAAADTAGDAAEKGAKAARPEDVKALLADLLDAAATAEGQRRACRGERVFELDTARAMVNGSVGPTAGIIPTPGGDSPRARRAAGYLLKPMFLADARLMADFMTGAAAASDAPDWPTSRARMPASPERQIMEHRQLHLLASLLLPSVNRTAQQTYRGMAGRRMAAVAVAARWYALGHGGRLPDRLDDLVPAYLPTVPADPLTTGRPLGYVPAGERPIVYSVGEDGRDDGGQELPPDANWKARQGPHDEVVHLTRQPRPPKEPEKKPQPWE